MICLDFLYHTSYTDRKVRRINGYGDYNGSSGSFATLLRTMEDIDFNPNDSVDTQVILETASFADLTQEPNYMVVRDKQPAGGGSYTHTILSRWYVMEIRRLRGGQYRISLRRDVIADNYNAIKDETCFIERGPCPADSYQIFNDEGIVFNQVKFDEFPLKDATQVPWLVGYVAQYQGTTEPLSPVNLVGTIYRTQPVALELDTTIANDPDFGVVCGPEDNINYIAGDDMSDLNIGYTFEARYGSSSNYVTKRVCIKADGTWLVDNNLYITGTPTNLKWNGYNPTDTQINQLAQRCKDVAGSYNTQTNKRAAFPSNTILIDSTHTQVPIISQSKIYTVMQYQNQIVKDSAGKYYRIKVEQYPNTYSIHNYTPPTSTWAYSAPKLAWDDEVGEYETLTEGSGDNTKNSAVLGFARSYAAYYIDVTDEYHSGTVQSCKYNTAGHAITVDAPYNIIAVPYADGKVQIGSGPINSISKEIGMNLMSRIAKDSSVYDIQLLPYCPIEGITAVSGDTVKLVAPGGMQEGYDYSYIKTADTDLEVGIIFNVPKASFSFTIDAPLYSWEEPEPQATIKKIKALTRFTRICSPNYSGVFEFNKQKNDGLDYFEVNCTYKPMSPYIHINPNWGGLYGRDFNDNRGLICQGDFSLPIVKDSWLQYQLQNKNFQNLFNRQIEHMETSYSIQNELAGWNIAGGALAAAGTGAAMGSMLTAGNPVGAVVGGVAAAGGSALAGMKDLEYQKKTQAEALSYTKDVFDMNLQNIKALPNSLTRVGTFDIDNKIFPFIEEYRCTPEEEGLLLTKMQLQGMNVSRFDTIENELINPYVYTFIQGKIVFTNTNTSFDAHTSEAIYNELAKGVRIRP